MAVLRMDNKSHINRAAFFDGDVGIQRYDDIKYRAFDKLTEKQLGFFWLPTEVDILRDAKDFKELTNTKNIFLQVI